MPKGPQGQKRPADVIGNAIAVAKIATGEIEEDTTDNKQYAREGGRKGGNARAKSLTEQKRKEIARMAALARWKKTETK
ncbi:MAG: RNA-binding protein [Syntrophorhabdales bacterium]|jgi:hypothetical protein